jgi:hypothetical protein
MCYNYNLFGTVAQWFAGSVTFLAVIVALFKEKIFRYWERPKLRISISLSPPDCYKGRYKTKNGASVELYNLRLWVENYGKTQAELVQVYVAKLLRESDADRVFRDFEGFLPMNLKWAHAQEIFTPGISPTMGRHCRLGHLFDPQARKEVCDELEGVPDDHTILSLDLEVTTGIRSHLIPPGTYRLQLKIAASNCAVMTKTLKLTISGKWFAEETRMYRDGVAVEIIK